MKRVSRSALLLLVPLWPACDKHEQRDEATGREYVPPARAPEQQTANEESLDEQEQGIQRHGGELEEKEPVGGEDATDASPPRDRFEL